MPQGDNIYSLLLSLGAPPETIMRLMGQMKGGTPLMDNRAVGMKGNVGAQSPFNSRPSGPYASLTPPRVR